MRLRRWLLAIIAIGLAGALLFVWYRLGPSVCDYIVSADNAVDGLNNLSTTTCEVLLSPEGPLTEFRFYQAGCKVWSEEVANGRGCNKVGIRHSQYTTTQELAFAPAAEWNPEGTIGWPLWSDFSLAHDINFDGFRDIKILSEKGASNESFHFYVFDQASGIFIDMPGLPEHINNPMIDSEAQIIKSVVHGGACSEFVTSFHFNGSRYEEVGSEDVDVCQI